MLDETPKIIVEALTTAMEEAEQVFTSTGAEKKAFVLQAVKAVAARALSVEDAFLVDTLAPVFIDALVSASKGLLQVHGGGYLDTCCTLL
jgi:hypothetical protein